MYSWDEDPSSWYGKGEYAYKPSGSAAREKAAERARAGGPRTYEGRGSPNPKITDPKKCITSVSPNPLIIAVDVTGSMASWPAEIFDRLPLLYNTLSQYRPDLEICFAAIGDAAVDQFPLQVTTFAGGFDLEQQLGALYGEGGGGDAPESYGLFAHWVNTHVQVSNTAEKPFLIIFGDVHMHPVTPAGQVTHYLGDESADINSLSAWQKVTQNWNTWFLRRPTGSRGDQVDEMWGQAIGDQKIFHIEDEQRAVDYAMGLIARSWGFFGDFRENMRARQDDTKVAQVSQPIAMLCPGCGGPIPVEAKGMFKCPYCSMTLKL